MFLLLTLLLTFSHQIFATGTEDRLLLINSDLLKYNQSEENTALNLSSSLKLIEKGYISRSVVKNTIDSLGKSKIFTTFLPYFETLEIFIKKYPKEDIIESCSSYSALKPNLSVEKRIHKIIANFCREKSLEQISRKFEKSKTISDLDLNFIKDNLRHFLSSKMNKSFSYFLQSMSSDKNLLKKFSEIITDFSVKHDKIPHQDVLQDIEINEKITKLIQQKGFNPLHHKNVFYVEFSKLIDQGYKLLNNDEVKNSDQKKLLNHFSYLKNFIELNQDHLPLSKCLSRLNDLSKSIYRAGLLELSRDIFTYIIKKNDKSIVEDTYFYYLWTYIRENNFNGAIDFAKKYDLLSPTKNLSEPRIKFWLAQAEEQRKNVDKAALYYEAIISQNPLSFYAIMSSKRLFQIKPTSPQTLIYLNDSKKTHSYSLKTSELDSDHLNSLARLQIWTKINHVKFKELELKQLKNHFFPNLVTKYPTNLQPNITTELHLINAKIMQSSSHLAAFKYLYEAFEKKQLNFNKNLLEILYPRPYFGDLKKILSNDEIDPIILLSLIRQESVFNPFARSSVGARGLMQLMPMTAKRFKRGVSTTQLNNPMINMEIGTKYFKNLLKRYNNNLVYVLSAYNAGESRVERWKNLYWDSEASILRNIEEIPFLETRNYVKLIFRNIFFYKILDQPEVVADNFQLNQIYNISLGFKH
jgi:soluble lytic murein transglycosylase